MLSKFTITMQIKAWEQKLWNVCSVLPSITTLISASLTGQRQKMEKPRKKDKKVTKHCKGYAFYRGFFKTSKQAASKNFQYATNWEQTVQRSKVLHSAFFYPIFPFPSLHELLSRQTGHERSASINSTPPSFTALPQPQSKTCLQQSNANCINTQKYTKQNNKMLITSICD